MKVHGDQDHGAGRNDSRNNLIAKRRQSENMEEGEKGMDTLGRRGR